MSYALEINDLVKVYKSGTKALNGIDLKVQEGDFFALLGPNGAGKSTTIGIITSLVSKTSGAVKVYGRDLNSDLQDVKSLIGLVPQEFNFNIFQTVENIWYTQAGYYGISRSKAKDNVEKYLKALGLWDKRKQKAVALSGGMKRRLMIGRALIHNPKLLILDEPTAGVDIELRRSLWDFLSDLNAQGTTIILTTHYLEEAESLCRNIAIIDRGEIVRDTSMRVLLGELESETFILDVEHALESLPDGLTDFKITLLDSHSVEVCVKQGDNLNQLFAHLSEHNIHVKSMRNKSNRLEELFINLTTRDE